MYKTVNAENDIWISELEVKVMLEGLGKIQTRWKEPYKYTVNYSGEAHDQVHCVLNYIRGVNKGVIDNCFDESSQM